ncbi:MAG: InlB B-repeat-containing protein [Treponema sp.]|jgi:uncharacterized repeat protein (TIGR02543 family)|nr:InlB B-repeat-containing protein [Treponema sp.]
MKKIVLLLTVFVVLTGCFTDWRGEGTLTISLGGGSGRSVLDEYYSKAGEDDPATLKRINHKITIYRDGKLYEEIPDAKGGETINRTVPTGHYKVDVKASIKKTTAETENNEIHGYKIGDEIPFARGSGEGNVSAGKKETIKVKMGQFKFTVTLIPDNGDQKEIRHILPGDTDYEFPKFVKGGYKFEGWHLNGNEFDEGTPITADITLYAKWFHSIGIDWEAVDVSTLFAVSTINGIAYGGGKFVAVGKGKMAHSTNGTDWELVGDSKFGISNINSIAYGNSKFVAVGDGGNMAHSTNGTGWELVGDSKFGTSNINSIAYGGGKFVAVGDSGNMAYSTNGEVWITVNSVLTSINSIAYGGDKFVAGGASTNIQYSTNGINWYSVNTGLTADTQSIAYGGGKFVAGGANGMMKYSTDGINKWTAVIDSPFITGDIIQSIAYGGNRFVAGGGKKMAHSTNGTDWYAITDSPFITEGIIESIAYGNNKFVAVGYEFDTNSVPNGKMAYSE